MWDLVLAFQAQRKMIAVEVDEGRISRERANAEIEIARAQTAQMAQARIGASMAAAAALVPPWPPIHTSVTVEHYGDGCGLNGCW
jgi:hypothetical protein